MNGRGFLDTNILVYAYDRSDPGKQQRAQELLASSIREESGALSTQVLGEFFVVATRRIPAPLSVAEASEILDAVSVLPVEEIDLPLVRKALETVRAHAVSYWDALILAAAERAGCTTLFTEDLDAGHHDQIGRAHV